MLYPKIGFSTCVFYKSLSANDKKFYKIKKVGIEFNSATKSKETRNKILG